MSYIYTVDCGRNTGVFVTQIENIYDMYSLCTTFPNLHVVFIMLLFYTDMFCVYLSCVWLSMSNISTSLPPPSHSQKNSHAHFDTIFNLTASIFFTHTAHTEIHTHAQTHRHVWWRGHFKVKGKKKRVRYDKILHLGGTDFITGKKLERWCSDAHLHKIKREKMCRGWL